MNALVSPNKPERLARLPPLSYDIEVKTLTIRLPDVLAKQIEKESQSRRVSKSDIVRERLAAVPAAGAVHPLADILEECWKAKVPAELPRFHSPKKQKLAEIIRAKKLHR